MLIAISDPHQRVLSFRIFHLLREKARFFRAGVPVLRIIQEKLVSHDHSSFVVTSRQRFGAHVEERRSPETTLVFRLQFVANATRRWRCASAGSWLPHLSKKFFFSRPELSDAGITSRLSRRSSRRSAHGSFRVRSDS